MMFMIWTDQQVSRYRLKSQGVGPPKSAKKGKEMSQNQDVMASQKGAGSHKLSKRLAQSQERS